MKNLIRLITVIILGLLTLPTLSALELEQGEVEFNIRLVDRRIYYIANAAKGIDPIYVQVNITNNSPNPYRFKLADDRAFSIDVDVRSMTNRQLPQADSLLRKRTETGKIFFREISIETGESYSFIENLRDYVRFEQPGSYRLRVFVYPELFRTAAAPASERPIETNYLNVNLRPALIPGPDGLPLEMDVATGAVLVKQQLPPDEVVAYMITSRQESQWERFFLYLDLESMLLRNEHQRRRYIAENEAGRRRMVNEFRQSLKESVIDNTIAQVPMFFEILKTEYNHSEATVVVLQKYRMPNYVELRHYTYFLERKDNFWIIVHYGVQGMGTEAVPRTIN
ncbi:MAG: hypothetical protein FWB73_05700 [Treponema sp.]|nr:hypothetical protein [Treponema sp.]